jgi:hypothetical protein
MANVERLRKLRQRLLDHKEQFRYSEWGGVLSDDEFDIKPRLLTVTNKVKELKELLETYSCNTCGCIAGNACMQAIEENDPVIVDQPPNRPLYISDIASEYLDLQTPGERRFLFMGADGCQLDFTCHLPQIDITKATVHDAIRRLDVLIEHYK